MKTVKKQDIVVAILPFTNLSGDKELNHITYGFSEDLITDLSRFSALQVISHHSTKNIDFSDDQHRPLIESLRCDYLITGSIRIGKDQIRINTQLIETHADKVIWGEKYNAPLASIFDIQDEIIEQVVNVFQKQIEINLLSSTRKKNLDNLEAYESWLRGMELLKTGSLEKDEEARKYFKQALKIDENYSRAYSGLSLSYFNEWTCQEWKLWESSQEGAQKYAEKAVAIDEADYVSLAVLGRIHMYKRQFEKAEHFLRKSLQLNPNDSDNLIQISSCFVFMGYPEEADVLYRKAMRLNPLNTQWYYQIGALIAFELGKFRECIDLVQKVNIENTWVDLPAYVAAAHYHLGEIEKVDEWWAIYEKRYLAKIDSGLDGESDAALDWFVTINPYQKANNLLPFFRFKGYKGELAYHNKVSKPIEIEELSSFRPNDGLWEIQFNGVTKSMANLKGFHDISRLLASPNEPIHCSALMGSVIAHQNDQLVFDDLAKKAYQDRIINIQEEIQEAESRQDYASTEKLRKEYDDLLEHLSKSVGIKGKTRKLDSPIEKARSAVTWRIRSAIKKIEKVHPDFAKHLNKSIQTGTFCTYSPEFKINWLLN